LIHLFSFLLASYVQKLLLFDASSGNFRVIKLRPRSKDCIINGDNPTLRELIDYQQFCGSGAHDKVFFFFVNKKPSQNNESFNSFFSFSFFPKDCSSKNFEARRKNYL